MQEYYLSDSQNELSRLAFQHQVWAKETVDLWQRAKFMPGDRILDLGCGPGYTTLDLAQLVGPSGKVTGVDSSEKFISYLDKTLEATATRNVETHICDISKLPFSPSCFDGIYSRMVMCFLKDPKAVLTNLVKMLKPGGKMVITDFFSYADSFFVVPESKAITKAMKGIEKGNSVLGGNFNVQRKIPSDLSDLGLDIIDTKASVRTGNSKDSFWYWPESYFQNVLPSLVEKQLLSQTEVDDFWRDWNLRKGDKNAFFLGPILLDIIAVKPKGH